MQKPEIVPLTTDYYQEGEAQPSTTDYCHHRDVLKGTCRTPGKLLHRHHNSEWEIYLRLNLVEPIQFHGTGILTYKTSIKNQPFMQVNIQGTFGCTSNSVPMVFVVFSRDSWGL